MFLQTSGYKSFQDRKESYAKWSRNNLDNVLNSINHLPLQPNVRSMIANAIATKQWRVEISKKWYDKQTGNSPDYQSFTMRLNDNQPGDKPNFETIMEQAIGAVLLGQVFNAGYIFQASIFSRNFQPFVSWMVAETYVVAYHMAHGLGTIDKRNGSEGCAFRKLPFKAMNKPEYTGRVYYVIGQTITGWRPFN